jgi:hypothetical protein
MKPKGFEVMSGKGSQRHGFSEGFSRGREKAREKAKEQTGGVLSYMRYQGSDGNYNRWKRMGFWIGVGMFYGLVLVLVYRMITGDWWLRLGGVIQGLRGTG